MGMRLRADYTAPAPYPVVLTVVCDASHGRSAPQASFAAEPEHPRDAAVRAGWTIFADGLVLCPECSGRVGD